MAKAKKNATTKKFAAVKRMITPNDGRIKKASQVQPQKQEATAPRHVTQTSSGLFFSHNASLGPPYHVLIDTNFINFSIQNKLDILRSLMDALYAKVVVCITDAVMAELEKLGPK